jgi:hypothetical protein
MRSEAIELGWHLGNAGVARLIGFVPDEQVPTSILMLTT